MLDSRIVPEHPDTMAISQDVETSLDLLLWRSALSQAPEIPDVSDQLRLAQMCQEAGLGVWGRMLYQTAFLRFGLSPRSFARQTDFASIPEVWRSPLSIPDGERDTRGTVDRAVAELRAFAGAHAARLATNFDRPAAVDRAADDASEPNFGVLPTIINDLYNFLLADAPEDGWNAAEDQLTRIRRLNQSAGRFDYRAFATAPFPLLAAAMSLASLREFFLLNSDFIFGALGSAALLHAVARFDDSGLGPYLTNLPRVVRKSQDLFELARIAKAAGEDVGVSVPIERWIVLLSARLSGSLRDEVVDDLGDLGATEALTALYDRAVRQPGHRIEISLIMRLRDAALDNGDFALGARAQGLLVRLFPDQMLERRLLAEINATAGMLRVAEQGLLECLAAAPGDEMVLERLAALRAGNITELQIRHGFGTPPERLRNRLRRRELGII